ncbi:MAG: hypothetical protein ACOX5G_13060 [Kiritimatiellia bacterium]|jgi:hypothetical protein
MKTICFNEHFYAKHPPEDMTRRGCRALVDAYARTGTIRSPLFCVNLQRTLYESEVWERFRDLPPDTQYVRNLRLLAERGVDPFSEWLARCRETGIEGRLSMRMNDAHGLKEAVREIPSPPVALWRHLLRPGTRVNVAVGQAATPHAAFPPDAAASQC